MLIVRSPPPLDSTSSAGSLPLEPELATFKVPMVLLRKRPVATAVPNAALIMTPPWAWTALAQSKWLLLISNVSVPVGVTARSWANGTMFVCVLWIVLAWPGGAQEERHRGA